MHGGYCSNAAGITATARGERWGEGYFAGAGWLSTIRTE
ncbi:hypothetical protein KPK_4609 [Klebsiella variicola]|uniref:Uncharacterized protein n=1 Tax=Klebsiella variicola (strain 342) TaxID=507522 RepID=B5Y1R0_KLEV3|nr:hypothetical protein KPK_4609 [Klebsiella variicola]